MWYNWMVMPAVPLLCMLYFLCLFSLYIQISWAVLIAWWSFAMNLSLWQIIIFFTNFLLFQCQNVTLQITQSISAMSQKVIISNIPYLHIFKYEKQICFFLIELLAFNTSLIPCSFLFLRQDLVSTKDLSRLILTIKH